MIWIIIGVVAIVALCCAKVALDMAAAHAGEEAEAEAARLERIRQSEADMRALLRGKRDKEGHDL